jgi:hypothetical protein
VAHESDLLLPALAAAALQTMSALAVVFGSEGRIVYFN